MSPAASTANAVAASHELADFGFWIALLVQIRRRPNAVRLIRDKPTDAFLASGIDRFVLRISDALEGQHREPRGIAIADGARYSNALRGPGVLFAVRDAELGGRPTAVGFLLLHECRDDGVLFFFIKNPRQLRRCPQRKHAIVQPLLRRFRREKLRQQRNLRLHVRLLAIILARHADREAGERRAKENAVGFPWPQAEVEPLPGAVRLLHCPR